MFSNVEGTCPIQEVATIRNIPNVLFVKTVTKWNICVPAQIVSNSDVYKPFSRPFYQVYKSQLSLLQVSQVQQIKGGLHMFKMSWDLTPHYECQDPYCPLCVCDRCTRSKLYCRCRHWQSCYPISVSTLIVQIAIVGSAGAKCVENSSVIVPAPFTGFFKTNDSFITKITDLEGDKNCQK